MTKVSDFLAKQLKAQRKRLRLSQEQFAEKVGISLPLISELERGRANPTLQTLGKISDALGMSVAELLDVDGTLADPERIRDRIDDALKGMNAEQLKMVVALLDMTRGK
jgi:transcriptional regulator with XRE-family HTH domain